MLLQLFCFIEMRYSKTGLKLNYGIVVILSRIISPTV